MQIPDVARRGDAVVCLNSERGQRVGDVVR
jgi:hypothetical protein